MSDSNLKTKLLNPRKMALFYVALGFFHPMFLDKTCMMWRPKIVASLARSLCQNVPAQNEASNQDIFASKNMIVVVDTKNTTFFFSYRIVLLRQKSENIC